MMPSPARGGSGPPAGQTEFGLQAGTRRFSSCSYAQKGSLPSSGKAALLPCRYRPTASEVERDAGAHASGGEVYQMLRYFAVIAGAALSIYSIAAV